MTARPVPAVLSIQSQVAEGHVGNSAAVFPMQRLGIEVVPVHTLQFSNHPGHGSFGGKVFSADHVGAVLEGLLRRGTVGRLDAILTGYLGSADIAGTVADFVVEARRINPELVIICDPVIGDRARGLYVSEALAVAIRDRLLPLSDILLPNAFELEWLGGVEVASCEAVASAVVRLSANTGRRIVVTSLDYAELGPDSLATMVFDREGSATFFQRRLPAQFSGAGDCFAALVTAYLLRQGDLRRAVAQAVIAVSAVLLKTLRLRRDELALVAAQGAFRLRAPAEIERALERLCGSISGSGPDP